MSVVATSTRNGWHLSHSSGPGKIPGARRPAGGSPTLTVTFSIPLASDDGLTPQAFRLLEVARELVERGEGTVSLSPPPAATEPVYAEPADEPLVGTAVAVGEGTALHVLAASRTVLLEGAQLRLTRLEFDLLLFLADNPRRVFSRLQLLTGVWGYEHAGARTVDVHIRRLRSKIGMHVPLVTTVYGVGYRLADDARVLVEREA